MQIPRKGYDGDAVLPVSLEQGEESLTTIVAAIAEKERELRQKVEESLKTTFEADRKVLVANAEKERELRQKGEEGINL
ncbi:g10715 [Coccomyxa elongata]